MPIKSRCSSSRIPSGIGRCGEEVDMTIEVRKVESVKATADDG